MGTIPHDARIVIIGAGCFGVSAAFHLLSRGHTDVTLLDRSSTLPAPDAASNDINRIVRTSYSDKFYSGLAREAIASWKDNDIWGDAYHESGVVILGLSDQGTDRDSGTYADDSYRNDVNLGCRVEILRTTEDIRACFPPQIPSPRFYNSIGYHNLDGGWVNAARGLSLLLKRVASLNGKIFPAKNVVKLCPLETISKYGGPTTEIRCSDSTVLNADIVIVATGSWTASAFPELTLGDVCLATGQCMATVQLSQKEADNYRQCPVVLDFNSGFYIFPPNEDNVVKLAIHSAGYTHFEGERHSSPRTITSDPEKGLMIPRTALADLRKHLRNIFPELAEKPFRSTRLCWYNDTPDGNWIIGRHPANPSIILATGDSGHAYKFLPVIGHLIVDIMEDKLSTELVNKFSIDRQVGHGDKSRSGRPVELELDQLSGIQDLYQA